MSDRNYCFCSGPNDRVFVNFVDHGAPGLIAFPRDELHATALMDAVKNMHSQQKFKELVFYIEACESGSMFQDLLPDDINGTLLYRLVC